MSGKFGLDVAQNATQPLKSRKDSRRFLVSLDYPIWEIPISGFFGADTGNFQNLHDLKKGFGGLRPRPVGLVLRSWGSGFKGISGLGI